MTNKEMLIKRISEMTNEQCEEFTKFLESQEGKDMAKTIEVVLIEKIEVVYNSTPEEPELKAGVQITYRNPMNSISENKVIPAITGFQIHHINEMLRNLLSIVKCTDIEVKFDNFKQWSDLLEAISEQVKDKPFTLYEDSKKGFIFM